MARVPARGGDDQLGLLPVHLRQPGDVLGPQQHLLGPDDLQRVGALHVHRVLAPVHHGDQGAEFDQGVGGGEAGQAQARHDHAQALPVRIPAG